MTMMLKMFKMLTLMIIRQDFEEERSVGANLYLTQGIKMKTFDVNVSVLNTNVVWKQRTTENYATQTANQTANQMANQTANQTANQVVNQTANQTANQTTTPEPVIVQFPCNWQPPLKLEMIFLTLPFFILLSLAVTFQQKANVHVLSILIGSTLVLVTPVVFVAWQNLRSRVNKQNYVHMFLIHCA
jgi:hypothetical protein